MLQLLTLNLIPRDYILIIELIFLKNILFFALVQKIILFEQMIPVFENHLWTFILLIFCEHTKHIRDDVDKFLWGIESFLKMRIDDVQKLLKNFNAIG